VGTYPPSARPRRRGRCYAIYSTDELYAKYANNANYASYEYYEAAAEEEVPGYRVELARSGRSKCAKCDGYIEKGSLRVGSRDKFAGTYGMWNHLGGCWRVPVKVQ